MTPDPVEREADWATEKAAQCWCDPTVSDRVMDPALCLVIAQALRAERERVIKAGGIVAKDVYDKGFREGFASCRETILRMGDDNKPQFKDIHPQLQWFLEKVRSLQPSEKTGGA